MYKSRRRKTSVRNTHPSKNQRNRSQKATRKQSEAGNNALKGKRGTLIRNESASSSKYFLAESSDKDTPVQYLRPNLHPIYQPSPDFAILCLLQEAQARTTSYALS